MGRLQSKSGLAPSPAVRATLRIRWRGTRTGTVEWGAVFGLGGGGGGGRGGGGGCWERSGAEGVGGEEKTLSCAANAEKLLGRLLPAAHMHTRLFSPRWQE